MALFNMKSLFNNSVRPSCRHKRSPKKSQMAIKNHFPTRYFLERRSSTCSKQTSWSRKTFARQVLSLNFEGRSSSKLSESMRCNCSDGSLGLQNLSPVGIKFTSPRISQRSPQRKVFSSRRVPVSRSVSTKARSAPPTFRFPGASSVSLNVSREFWKAHPSTSSKSKTARSPESSMRKKVRTMVRRRSMTSSRGSQRLSSTSSYSESLPGSSRPAGRPAFTWRL
mmetsp:Transcript_54402/g.119088  ORF Transcript_54402/g.119088 Transcript_54402/m.119088 type:complete len:224 (-) Transcript_54402:937-1608(-)